MRVALLRAEHNRRLAVPNGVQQKVREDPVEGHGIRNRGEVARHLQQERRLLRNGFRRDLLEQGLEGDGLRLDADPPGIES